MARIRDWINLGKNTVRSVSADDVTGLYELEWPETKKILIADHRGAIEQEPRRVKRWLRTGSAIVYGLAKRLAPQRRILFLVSLIGFFACLFAIVEQTESAPILVMVAITATFLVMTALLAMELIDKIKIRDELVLARDLQATLIPAALPQTGDYEIAAYNSIANTVGGDIYDVVPLPDGRLAVLFGDASGHGMAAGLVMAVAHAAFRTQLDIDPSPSAITASLNRILCRTGGSRSFFSCVYLILAPDGSFVATVAGHPPILKLDQNGRVVDRFGLGAYPLGIKVALQWEEIRDRLLPGQQLLLYSDGLTEARNGAGQEFGEQAVESIAAWHPDAPPQTLIDNLVGELRIFTAGHGPADDVSIAAIRKRSS